MIFSVKDPDFNKLLEIMALSCQLLLKISAYSPYTLNVAMVQTKS